MASRIGERPTTGRVKEAILAVGDEYAVKPLIYSELTVKYPPKVIPEPTAAIVVSPRNRASRQILSGFDPTEVQGCWPWLTRCFPWFFARLSSAGS